MARARGAGGKKRLAADPVFEALAGAILRGKYTAGSALPPERELSALFNVSRLIVRQALHRLRDMGLVKGGQGGQNTVLDPDTSNDLRIVALTMKIAPERTDQQDVIERQLLGGAMLLDLAEGRMTDAQIDTLESVIDKIESLRTAQRPIGEGESEFWEKVADATGNRILGREARYWFEVMRSQPARRERIYDVPELRIVAYRAIVENLRNRSGAADAFRASIKPILQARRSEAAP